MKPFRLRRLTASERALAREMFGEGLEADRVRILAIPVWPRAFVAGPSLIVWPAQALPVDFGAASLRAQATLVHELTHVWQAQSGVRLILAKLRAGDSAAAYAYDLTVDTDFAALNIEQQAMVVEHAFLASRGVATPFAAELYVNAVWRRGQA
jgi:hypothetical protein